MRCNKITSRGIYCQPQSKYFKYHLNSVDIRQDYNGHTEGSPCKDTRGRQSPSSHGEMAEETNLTGILISVLGLSFQDWKKTNFCISSPPIYGTLL